MMAGQEIHGYDVEFVNKPAFDVTCSICLCTLRIPVQVEPCGHTFCLNCMKTLREKGNKEVRCPEDQGVIEQEFRDRRLERDILQLQVKCINNSKGCEWVGVMKDLDTHIGECLNEEIKCLLEDCHEIMERRFISNHQETECHFRSIVCEYCKNEYVFNYKEKHKETCEDFPISCEYECGAIVPKIQIARHIGEECPMKLRPCQFKSIGCDEEGTLSWQKDHMCSHRDIHLSLAVKKISVQETEMKTLITTLIDAQNGLEDKIKQQGICLKKREEEVDDLRKKLEILENGNEKALARVKTLTSFRFQQRIRDTK